MPKSGDNLCPLCHGGTIAAYHTDRARDYLQCGTCDLVFVPPSRHLPPAEEKAYYDLHDNQPDDPGYRRFLCRLFSPLNQRLAADARGLDFGCGPGPALSRMFVEAGYEMALYDPYYVPDRSVLAGPYDFITLSEVAEHLAEPGEELDHLWDSLTPGGWLGIMTKRVRDPEAFKTWHYITDPTHISYFSEATFHWLAAHWSHKGQAATLTIAGNDVVLINKA
jgi:ribosomal protein S27AE